MGDQMAGLVLDERGIVCDCDNGCETLFGHSRDEMVSRHVAMLLPQLADIDLLTDGQPNSKLRFLSRIGVRFHALNRSGERFLCNLFLNNLGNQESRRLRMIVRRGEQ